MSKWRYVPGLHDVLRFPGALGCSLQKWRKASYRVSAQDRRFLQGPPVPSEVRVSELRVRRGKMRQGGREAKFADIPAFYFFRSEHCWMEAPTRSSPGGCSKGRRFPPAIGCLILCTVSSLTSVSVYRILGGLRCPGGSRGHLMHHGSRKEFSVCLFGVAAYRTNKKPHYVHTISADAIDDDSLRLTT